MFYRWKFHRGTRLERMNSPIMSPFILYLIVAQSPFELSEILLVSFCFVCLIKSVLFLFCNSHWNPFIFQPTQIRRVCFSGFLPRRKFVIFGSVLSVMKTGSLSEFVQRWLITYVTWSISYDNIHIIWSRLLK